MTDSPAPHLQILPQGLYAPAFDAWIDPPAPAARAILSHGHADHAAAGHGAGWATAETLAIYPRGTPDCARVARRLAFTQPVPGDGATLALFPSGHILGAAQIRIEGAGTSGLYTGDFRRGASRTAPPAAAPPADELI